MELDTNQLFWIHMNNTQHPSSCIVAIGKNEGIYLDEWISFHKKVGFNHIYFFNNESSDETIHNLRNHRDFVTILDWPTKEGESPQISAYNTFLKYFRNSHDFAAFIDIDEFLVCKTETSINNYLAKTPENIGAIAVNQRIFGSSEKKHYEQAPVTERFIKCNKEENAENLWFKTIYRLRAIDVINDCHAGNLSPKYLYSDANFNVNNFDKEKPKQTINPALNNIQLNHYILKSEDEFMKKRMRGGAMGSTQQERLARHENHYWFFTYRDETANLCEDVFARDFYRAGA